MPSLPSAPSHALLAPVRAQRLELQPRFPRPGAPRKLGQVLDLVRVSSTTHGALKILTSIGAGLHFASIRCDFRPNLMALRCR
jgi:hypothetical protein